MKRIILFLLAVSLVVNAQEMKNDQIKANASYKRLFDAAHPRPKKFAKVDFLIPTVTQTSNSLFLNVDMVEDGSESSKMQNESSIAINPTDPLNMIASAVDYRDNSSTWVYVSIDGGKSWKNINLGKPFTGWTSTNDPSVAFSSDGIGYLVYGGFGQMSTDQSLTYGENGVFISKTYDKGATWTKHIPVILHKGQQTLDSAFEDKYYISVDNSPISPYFKHLYIPWKRVSLRDSATQIVMAKSKDSANTWTTPVNISHRISGSSEDTTFGQSFPLITTGPNGEVYCVWNHGLEHAVGFAKSLDGGATFSQPRLIHKYNIFGITRKLAEGWRHTVKVKVRAESYPTIVCDINTPERLGYLYLCWAADSIPNIYFSRSTNGGDDWSKPVIVQSVTDNDQFWPWLSIDPKNGDLAVMYLDSRDDPNNIMINCYVSYSSDGGLTWIDRRASDISSDLRLNPFPGNSFAGDYSGSAFYNGKVYPSWVDMRNAKTNIYDSDAFTAIINTKAPETPLNFSANIIPETPTEILCTWQTPSSRVFGQTLNPIGLRYLLVRNDKIIAEIEDPIVHYDDKNLTAFEKYIYKLYCISGMDTSYPAIDTVFAGGARKPASPVILSVGGGNDNSIMVKIQLPSKRQDNETPLANLDKMKIFRDSILIDEIQKTTSDTGKVIEFTENLPARGYYSYMALVSDKSQPVNLSDTSNLIYGVTGQFPIDYSEPFTQLEKYLNDGGWGLTNDFYRTAPSCLTESPKGDYTTEKMYHFWLFPTINQGKEGFRIEFWHAAIVHQSDSAIVEYSRDFGKTFTYLGGFNRKTYPAWNDGTLNADDWKMESYTIPFSKTNDSVIVRFRLKSGLLSVADGWYIDDISVQQATDVKEQQKASNSDLFCYPNPANSFITVRFPSLLQNVKEVFLINPIGQRFELTRQKLGQDEMILNLADLAQGNYMLGVLLNNNEKFFSKITIIR